MSTTEMHGVSMSVLSRREARVGPDAVTVVGLLSPLDEDVTPLPHNLRLVEASLLRPPVALEARSLRDRGGQQFIVALRVYRHADRWIREPGLWTAGGSMVVADDTRLQAFIRDLSGYAYDPAVPLHDREEG